MTALILFVTVTSLYGLILGCSRRAVLPRVRARPPDEALSARVARHDWAERRPVLFFLAGADRQLARADPNRVAVRVAVRGRDPAEAVSPRHPAAVHDVVVSGPGARRARVVDLRLRVGVR